MAAAKTDPIPQVVLIGSDESFLEALSNRLRSNGYAAFSGASESDVLKQASDSPAGVAVLSLRDLMADGLRLLSNLKKAAPDWQVITLSNPENTRLSIDSMKAGSFVDLMLPLDLDVFMDRLKSAWDRSLEQTRKSGIRKRLEKIATSVAFAEAGDFDTSSRILAEPIDDEDD